jgi:hypothetical protein
MIKIKICLFKDNILLTSVYNTSGKKNMPTSFRLGARAIGTCLVLLAATWQLIGKWGN